MDPRQWLPPPPPMWARWALSIVVAVAVVAGVVYADHHAGPEAPTTEAGAEAEANRVADIAITEDEAPRSATLPAGAVPRSALERAIAGDVRRRIAQRELTGPLQAVACAPGAATRAGRTPYRCTIRSDGSAYPFVAVADDRRQRLTWCKVDPTPPNVNAPEILISASCRA